MGQHTIEMYCSWTMTNPHDLREGEHITRGCHVGMRCREIHNPGQSQSWPANDQNPLSIFDWQLIFQYFSIMGWVFLLLAVDLAWIWWPWPLTYTLIVVANLPIRCLQCVPVSHPLALALCNSSSRELMMSHNVVCYCLGTLTVFTFHFISFIPLPAEINGGCT